jgi:hypothetical protein
MDSCAYRRWKIRTYQSAMLKGTVQRDFLIAVFFTKWLNLVSIDMPQSDFEIF